MSKRRETGPVTSPTFPVSRRKRIIIDEEEEKEAVPRRKRIIIDNEEEKEDQCDDGDEVEESLQPNKRRSVSTDARHNGILNSLAHRTRYNTRSSELRGKRPTGYHQNAGAQKESEDDDDNDEYEEDSFISSEDDLKDDDEDYDDDEDEDNDSNYSSDRSDDNSTAHSSTNAKSSRRPTSLLANLYAMEEDDKEFDPYANQLRASSQVSTSPAKSEARSTSKSRERKRSATSNAVYNTDSASESALEESDDVGEEDDGSYTEEYDIPQANLLYCAPCDHYYSPDDFSGIQRKNTCDSDRFCLRHTSTSSFGASYRKPNSQMAATGLRLLPTSPQLTVPISNHSKPNPKYSQSKKKGKQLSLESDVEAEFDEDDNLEDNHHHRHPQPKTRRIVISSDEEEDEVEVRGRSNMLSSSSKPPQLRSSKARSNHNDKKAGHNHSRQEKHNDINSGMKKISRLKQQQVSENRDEDSDAEFAPNVVRQRHFPSPQGGLQPPTSSSITSSTSTNNNHTRITRTIRNAFARPVWEFSDDEVDNNIEQNRSSGPKSAAKRIQITDEDIGGDVAPTAKYNINSQPSVVSQQQWFQDDEVEDVTAQYRKEFVTVDLTVDSNEG
jgi:hypothetical protein